MKMRGRRAVSLFLAAALAGTLAAGCGKGSEDKKGGSEKGGTEKEEVSLPDGEKMTDEVESDFVQVNDLKSLCEKYGNIRIDSKYSNPDSEEVNANSKDSMLYGMSGETMISQSTSEGYESYSDGRIYMDMYQFEDESGEKKTSYSFTYNSESVTEEMGVEDTGIYYGSDGSADCVYNETKEGYEIYENFEAEDGSVNQNIYKASKDKVVTSMMSVTYPAKGEKYTNIEKTLVLDADAGPKKLEAFENGAFTVKVIKNAGTQEESAEEFKMPAETSFCGILSEKEALAYDPEGTQLIGEDQYDNSLVVTEDVVLYLVGITPEAEG